MSKYDITSPTAYLKSLFLTASIDGKEGRKVAAVDVPGAFLQTDQDDDKIIHFCLQGEMTLLLGKINPDKYEHFILYERIKPVLFAKLTKFDGWIDGWMDASLAGWMDASMAGWMR